MFTGKHFIWLAISGLIIALHILLNKKYKFSYKTTIMGSIVVRFFDNEQNNISSKIKDVFEEGNYNKEQDGIIFEGSLLYIPFKEKTNIAYFIVGFEVEKDSYFSDLCLQKQ